MPTSFSPRPWVSAELEDGIAARAAQYRALGSDSLEGELRDLLARHEQYMDRECLSLDAARTNILNSRGAAAGVERGQPAAPGLPGHAVRDGYAVRRADRDHGGRAA